MYLPHVQLTDSTARLGSPLVYTINGWTYVVDLGYTSTFFYSGMTSI